MADPTPLDLMRGRPRVLRSSRMESLTLGSLLVVLVLSIFYRPAPEVKVEAPQVQLVNSAALADTLLHLQVGTVVAPMQITARGGVPPYRFSVVPDMYYPNPPGMVVTLNGNVFGTPSQAGYYNLTLQVQDSSQRPDNWWIQVLPVKVGQVH